MHVLHRPILKLVSAKTLILYRSHCDLLLWSLNWKAYWGISEHDSLTPYLEIYHVSVLGGTDECSLNTSAELGCKLLWCNAENNLVFCFLISH